MRLTRRGRVVLEWLIALTFLGISIFGEGVYDALIH
jgi:hypothetical protein